MGWDTTYYTSSQTKPGGEGFSGFQGDFEKWLGGWVGKDLPKFDQPYPTSPATSGAANAAAKWMENPANLERAPWATNAIQEMVTTGRPWDEGAATYDVLKPIYERTRADEAAKLNESFGSMGGRYSSDLWRNQGELARKQTEDINAILAEKSLAAHEGAAGRALEAIKYTTPGSDILPALTEAGNLGLNDMTAKERGWNAQYADFIRSQMGLSPMIANYAANPASSQTSYAPNESIWPYLMQLMGGG